MTQPAPLPQSTPTPTVLLYSRSSRVTVGTIQIANIGRQIGLDVWFRIKRTLKKGDPNTCDVKVWNLSDSSRAAIDSSSAFAPSVTQPPAPAATFQGEAAPPPVRLIPVRIEAGYEQTVETLFLGEMRSGQTVRDGDDFVTEMTTGDGDQGSLVARANLFAAKGSNGATVVKNVLNVIGVSVGNLNSPAVQKLLQNSGIAKHGAVVKGNGIDIISDICFGCGLEFRVMAGTAQFLPIGQALPGQAYALSPTSGLIGEPSVDTKGVMSCKTEMLPGLKPGSPVVLQSRFVSGFYRITSIETTGSTWENDWGHQIEGKRINCAP